MNIEDLIFFMSCAPISLNRWDVQVVQSLADQTSRGTGFTEKQRQLAIRILKKHTTDLSAYVKSDVQTYIDNPVFKYPIRQLNNNKSISIVKDATNTTVIKVEFPYNETYVKEIQNHRGNNSLIHWDKDEKCWFFSLNESNIQFLMKLATKESFSIDETLIDYNDRIKEIQEHIEDYVPMLILEENTVKYKNVSPFVPALKSKEILESIFEARKYGILTWDDEIDKHLNRLNLNSTTLEFLSTDPGVKFVIDREEKTIDCLKDIIQYMGPTLVVIPGGAELETLRLSLNFFKDIGILNEEMSVMFRMPNISDKIFNDFVKENGLNLPICEKTKIVFVSGKLPKPVIKSGVKFHSMLNLGHENVHYTMREFLAKQENLIYYSAKSKQKEFSFGIV